MVKSNKSNNVSAKMYDTLVRPVITEKSMLSSEAGKVTFLVPLSATKDEVKAAVEAIFNVKVNKVNTIRQFGKEKRFRGYVGQRSDLAAIALLVRMVSRNQRAVDEATSWLKRVVVTWIILNTLGFIVAYLQPLIAGGQYTG